MRMFNLRNAAAAVARKSCVVGVGLTLTAVLVLQAFACEHRSPKLPPELERVRLLEEPPPSVEHPGAGHRHHHAKQQ